MLLYILRSNDGANENWNEPFVSLHIMHAQVRCDYDDCTIHKIDRYWLSYFLSLSFHLSIFFISFTRTHWMVRCARSTSLIEWKLMTMAKWNECRLARKSVVMKSSSSWYQELCRHLKARIAQNNKRTLQFKYKHLHKKLTHTKKRRKKDLLKSMRKKRTESMNNMANELQNDERVGRHCSTIKNARGEILS